MKIAYIVPALKNSGPVLVVKLLVELFQANGHECSVYYFDDLVELSFNCPTFKINRYRSIDFNKYDVVHSHGLRPDIYLFFYKDKISHKTLKVSTIHNYVLSDFSYEYNFIIAYIFGNLWMYCLKYHDRIATLSNHANQYYSKWFNRNLCTTVYNSRLIDMDYMLDDEDDKMIRSFKGSSILLGVNALLTKRKGVDILLHALVNLPEYKLIIVGDGKERLNLEKLASELEVSNRCLFWGYKKDAYRFLKYYDIYCMPSRSEGFPLSLLEAAFYSCPSVVSNLPVFEEIFENELEVQFFNLDNPSSIIQAIKKATNNLTMGVHMNHKYKKMYSPFIQMKKYLEIYESRI